MGQFEDKDKRQSQAQDAEEDGDEKWTPQWQGKAGKGWERPARPAV